MGENNARQGGATLRRPRARCVILPDAVFDFADSPFRGPVECGDTQPSRTRAGGSKAAIRTHPSFPNQLLTKLHGRTRMDRNDYGRELTNDQYTRTFSNLDGRSRTLACGFRSQCHLRPWNCCSGVSCRGSRPSDFAVGSRAFSCGLSRDEEEGDAGRISALWTSWRAVAALARFLTSTATGVLVPRNRGRGVHLDPSCARGHVESGNLAQAAKRLCLEPTRQIYKRALLRRCCEDMQIL